MSVSISPLSVKCWIQKPWGEQVAVILGIVPGQLTSPFISSGEGCHLWRRIRMKLLETSLQWTGVVQSLRLFTTKSRPANPLSLHCGLWAWCWTCADSGKLCRANDVSRVRGYRKENGSAVYVSGQPCSNLTGRSRILKSPSQTAVLQFSFSQLFYICLLICAWGLADAQLNSGCKTARQASCQSILKTHWVNPAVYWQRV